MGTPTVIDFRKGPDEADVVATDFGLTGVTLAKSGSTSAANGAGGTGPYITYEADFKNPTANGGGSFGVDIASIASTACCIDTIPITSGIRQRKQYVFRTLPTAPAADTRLDYLKNTAGTITHKLMQSVTGQLYLESISGGSNLTLKNAAGWDTWYILDVLLAVGTATAAPYDGKIRARLLNPDRSIAHAGGTNMVGTDTANLGTSPLNLYRAGISNGITTPLRMGIALIRFEDYPDTANIGSLSDLSAPNGDMQFFGTYTPPTNAPPNVPAVPAQTGTVAQPSTFTATPTDTDGTIASHLWVVTPVPATAPYTVSGAATASLVLTPGNNAGVGVRYDIAYTATDSGGAATTVNTKLTVPGTVIVAIEETTNPGGWSVMSGTNNAANRVAGVGDASDTTGMQAPAPTSTPSEVEQLLAPLLPAVEWSLPTDYKLSSAASAIYKLRLMQGATEKMRWNITALQAPTTSKQTVTLTHLNAEFGAIDDITDWTDLRLRDFWASA